MGGQEIAVAQGAKKWTLRPLASGTLWSRIELLNSMLNRDDTGDTEADRSMRCNAATSRCLCCAKTDEPIEMPFGLWTCGVGSYIKWGPEFPQRKRHLRGIFLTLFARGSSDAAFGYHLLLLLLIIIIKKFKKIIIINRFV